MMDGEVPMSQKSGKEKEKQYDDPHQSTDWKPSATEKDAFIDEGKRIEADKGVENPNNYKKINSPGKKHLP